MKRVAWLAGVLLPALALVRIAAGCAGQAASSVTFAGRARPPLAAPEDVSMLPDQETAMASGHAVIGVVSARCARFHAATNDVSSACSNRVMARACQQKAAEVGGTALTDFECSGSRSSMRYQGQADAGAGADPSEHSEVTCFATVLRHEGGGTARPAPAVDSGAPEAGPPPAFTFDVGGVEVGVVHEPLASAGDAGLVLPERPYTEVGEMDGFPAGYGTLGRLESRCSRGCARSVARRALTRAAGKLGALAISDVRCQDPGGELWSCRARTVIEHPSARRP